MKDFLLRAAVRKLHRHVVEETTHSEGERDSHEDRDDRVLYQGSVIALVYVQKEMRTLFAGLIDFDEE